jgi:hypothetical protein
MGVVLGVSLAVGCNHPNMSAGSTGAPGAGGGTGSGGVTGAGGSGSGLGGSSAPGTGGASGSGAGGSGSGGSSAPANDMIDNLDDNDGRIIMTAGRQGPWHSFNDTNGGNQQPPINGTFMPTSGGANGTPYAVHTTGSGYQYGGVGFDLNNATTTPESPQSMAYDASAYNGLTFWAKGSGTLRVEFSMRSFVPTDRGGTCTTNCWNVYGANTPTLTGSWQQITITFTSLVREDGSTSPAFTPAELMDISFKAGSTFDFWVDEVAFTRPGGGTGTGGSSGASGQGGASGTGQGGAGGTSSTTGAGGTSGAGGSSNVMHPPPITSGGTSGWGSRYWDCCKPSCGWKANAGGKSPANSCGVSDNNMGASDAANACFDNGPAYMCWNEAPWVLDDTLSYGFAAHNGVPCGRCFQLQFTGTAANGSPAGASALNGKTMIVQVTNIGNISSNQFDLLIPGGGVGAAGAGACQAQFGSSADLGAANGGLLTSCNHDKTCIMQKCQALFSGKADLAAGCDWFLNWFNAADNPDFTFKSIACPAAITQRSGLGDPGP